MGEGLLGMCPVDGFPYGDLDNLEGGLGNVDILRYPRGLQEPEDVLLGDYPRKFLAVHHREASDPGVSGRSPAASRTVALAAITTGSAVITSLTFMTNPQGMVPLPWSPSCSGKPHMRFMFWIAWPLAPFTRLSIAEATTTRSPSLSTAISQKFVPRTAARTGRRSR